MKYIDAEKLIESINGLMLQASQAEQLHLLTKEQEVCIISQLSRILSFIDSLQQEQPEVDANLGEPNVDLSDEIENFCLEYDARKEAWYNMLPKDQKLIYNPTWLNFATNLAHHFYNRGYNARKEE